MNARKILLVIAFIVCNSITAQVTYLENSSLQFNSDTNCQIRYHYFPNMQAYFDLQNKVYIYRDKGQWIEAEELPALYGGYSIYSQVRVEIVDYDEDKPYTQLNQHKRQFPYSKRGHFKYETTAVR